MVWLLQRKRLTMELRMHLIKLILDSESVLFFFLFFFVHRLFLQLAIIHFTCSEFYRRLFDVHQAKSIAFFRCIKWKAHIVRLDWNRGSTWYLMYHSLKIHTQCKPHTQRIFRSTLKHSSTATPPKILQRQWDADLRLSGSMSLTLTCICPSVSYLQTQLTSIHSLAHIYVCIFNFASRQ